MAQDDDAVTERPLGSGDPLVHLVVGETQVFLGERLALSDALFLDLVRSFMSIYLSPDPPRCAPARSLRARGA